AVVRRCLLLLRPALGAELCARRQLRAALDAELLGRERLAALDAELAAGNRRAAVRAACDDGFLERVLSDVADRPGLLTRVQHCGLNLCSRELFLQIGRASFAQVARSVPAVVVYPLTAALALVEVRHSLLHRLLKGGVVGL